MKLLDFFVAPVVRAVCASIRHDGHTWQRLYSSSGPLRHASGRFCVITHGNYFARITNASGDPASDLNSLEMYLLRRAYKSWVKQRDAVMTWKVKSMETEDLFSARMIKRQ